MHYRKQLGFSLIEIMITLVIISIIAMIAIPSYRDSVIKAHRTDARSAVLEVAALQEKHYFQFAQYSTDIATLAGCSASCATSPEGKYTIAISNAACGDSTCFTATATPVAGEGQDDDDTCATFSVTHTGLKSATDSGGGNSTEQCW